MCYKINMFSDRHKRAKISSRGKHAAWDFILATSTVGARKSLAFLSIYTGEVCCFFSQVFKDISGYTLIQKAYHPLQKDGSLIGDCIENCLQKLLSLPIPKPPRKQ